MKLSINFLKQHRKKLTSLEKEDKRYYMYSLYVAIGITVVACVIAGVNVFFSFSSQQVFAQKQSLEASILQQESIERDALILSAKVSALSELISQRGDKQEAIMYFTQAFGDEVIIKDINYQSRNGVLSLRIETPNVFLFEEVIDLLESNETRDRFLSLTKGELRRTSMGAYSVTATVVLATQDI